MASTSKFLAQTNKFPGRRRRHLRSVRPCVLQSGKGRTLPSICSALTCPGQHVSPCGRGLFRRWQRRTNLWRGRTNLRTGSERLRGVIRHLDPEALAFFAVGTVMASGFAMDLCWEFLMKQPTCRPKGATGLSADQLRVIAIRYVNNIPQR